MQKQLDNGKQYDYSDQQIGRRWKWDNLKSLHLTTIPCTTLLQWNRATPAMGSEPAALAQVTSNLQLLLSALSPPSLFKSGTSLEFSPLPPGSPSTCTQGLAASSSPSQLCVPLRHPLLAYSILAIRIQYAHISRSQKQKPWKKGWIQEGEYIWYIARTFINATIYPQHNNFLKKAKDLPWAHVLLRRIL
jgi:hypothetical protein